MPPVARARMELKPGAGNSAVSFMDGRSPIKLSALPPRVYVNRKQSWSPEFNPDGPRWDTSVV